jgi:hypothetical protein
VIPKYGQHGGYSHQRSRYLLTVASALMVLVLPLTSPSPLVAQGTPTGEYKYSDTHFHLTNYVQEGTNIKDYVAMMGNVVKRSTLFGIPLQQMWQFGNTGDYAQGARPATFQSRQFGRFVVRYDKPLRCAVNRILLGLFVGGS